MSVLSESHSISTRFEGQTPIPLPSAPYPGIRPFRFTDRPIFFGRGDDVESLVRAIKIYRGVLLFGESGTGKSSLVNAGLFFDMLRQGYVPDRVRVSPTPGGELVVERIAADPDGKTFLPSTLIKPDEANQRVVLGADELSARLGAMPSEWRSLLVFDQFEEFVTLFEDVPRGPEIEKARIAEENLLVAITRLLRDSNARLKLLFVFRDDYLARLQKLFDRYPRLIDQAVHLTALRTAALEEIVAGPFKEHPDGFSRPLDQDVCRSLVESLTARSVGDVINPSEVQVACRRLWESDNPGKVLEDRKVEGLLEDYMTDALNALPDEQRDVATAVLRHLVTSRGARNVKAEDDLIAVVQEDIGVSEPLVRSALKALEEEAKLVRRELRRNVTYYEIISEFLVEYIRRLRAKRLEEKLVDQEARHRQEQEQSQRLLVLEQSQRQAEADAAKREAKLAEAEADRRLQEERAGRLRRQKRTARRIMVGVIIAATVIVGLGAWVSIVELRADRLIAAQTADSLQRYAVLVAGLRAGQDSVNRVAAQQASGRAADSVARDASRRVDSLRLAGASAQQQLGVAQTALANERRARLISDSLRQTYEGAAIGAATTVSSLRDSIAKLQGLLYRTAVDTVNRGQRQPGGSANRILSMALLIHTGDDDKDADTRVQIDVPGVASGLSNGVRFSDGSDNVVNLALVKEGATLNDIMSVPVTICIYPNGNDEWRFTYTMLVRLADGSSRSFRQPEIRLSAKVQCHKSSLASASKA